MYGGICREFPRVENDAGPAKFGRPPTPLGVRKRFFGTVKMGFCPLAAANKKRTDRDFEGLLGRPLATTLPKGNKFGYRVSERGGGKVPDHVLFSVFFGLF